MANLADTYSLEKRLVQMSAKLNSARGGDSVNFYEPMADEYPDASPKIKGKGAAVDRTADGRGDDRRQGAALAAGGNPGAGNPPAGRLSNHGSAQSGSSAAGRGESHEQWNAARDIEDTQGPTVKDKTAAAAANDYRVHIRALTGIGAARVPTEDVMRPYRRALESVLTKEHLPPDRRDLIKGYFLSIGLGKENQGLE